jgi:hemoglobin
VRKSLIQRLIKKVGGLFEKSKYRLVGGMKVISPLVDDFYRIMENDPLASACLKTHAGKDLKDSGEKLKFFLSGWLGGPQLYLEKFGHPRLRMRHFPFAIGPLEGEQWLYCMDLALKNSTIKPSLQEELMRAFTQIVELIKNR